MSWLWAGTGSSAASASTRTACGWPTCVGLKGLSCPCPADRLTRVRVATWVDPLPIPVNRSLADLNVPVGRSPAGRRPRRSHATSGLVTQLTRTERCRGAARRHGGRSRRRRRLASSARSHTRVVMPAGAGALIDVGGPWAGQAGVAGPLHERITQSPVHGPAEPDDATLARLPARVEGVTPASEARASEGGTGRGRRRSRPAAVPRATPAGGAGSGRCARRRARAPAR